MSQSKPDPRLTFNPLLPSPPVALGKAGYHDAEGKFQEVGYSGHIGRLSIIYDMSRCQSLPDRLDVVTATATAAITTNLQAQDARVAAFHAEWEPYTRRLLESADSWEVVIAATAQALGDTSMDAAQRCARAREVLAFTPETTPPDPPSAEERAAYEAAGQAMETEIGALSVQFEELRVQRALAIIADVVVGVGEIQTRKGEGGKPEQILTWPFTGTPPPDPGAPETFRLFPLYVLEWIVKEGVDQVRRGMRSPLFGVRSRATIR